MIEVMICNCADKEIYFKQCDAIEKYVPNITKKETYMDVDSSETTIFYYGNQRIEVCCDRYINEVYVKSTEEIDKFFN